MPRRRRRPHSRRRKRSMELLWPFLLIILIGIIVVLVVQFVFTLLDQREAQLRNKIYFNLDRGSAQIIPWGETDWSKVYDGQLILEGDRLDLDRGSRGVMAFYNGTVVRLDAETELEVSELLNEKDGDEVHLDLHTGRLWANVMDSDTLQRFVVETDNMRVTSYGTIFEVGMTDRETVRVLDGEVMVEIFDVEEDREVVLEQIKVGVGQQIEVTSQDIETIIERQPVSLLEALDDDWKATEWYVWNDSEDASPTDFEVSEVGEAELTGEDLAEIEVEEEDEEAVVEDDIEEPEGEGVEEDTTAPVVEVTVPSESPYTFGDVETSISITGTTSANTEFVYVTSYDESGKGYIYQLQHYVAGSTDWRYGAAYEYGNLREGRNLFTITAENSSGVESEPVEVIIEVPEGTFESDEEEVVEEDSAPAQEDSQLLDLGDEPLTMPTVTSLNSDSMPAGNVYTTDADVITVYGTVSSSTAAVYVNGYQLSKYTPGSTTWMYYIREDLGNYDVGANSFTVVAEDADGNQSASYYFEVHREAF